jgi:hypothetical protein
MQRNEWIGIQVEIGLPRERPRARTKCPVFAVKADADPLDTVVVDAYLHTTIVS